MPTPTKSPRRVHFPVRTRTIFTPALVLARNGQDSNTIWADGFRPPRVVTTPDSCRGHTDRDGHGHDQPVRAIWETRAASGSTSTSTSSIKHSGSTVKRPPVAMASDQTAVCLVPPQPESTTADSTGRGSREPAELEMGDKAVGEGAKVQLVETTAGLRRRRYRRKRNASTVEGGAGRVSAFDGDGVGTSGVGAEEKGDGSGGIGGSSAGKRGRVGMKGHMAVQRATSKLMGEDLQSFVGVRYVMSCECSAVCAPCAVVCLYARLS